MNPEQSQEKNSPKALYSLEAKQMVEDMQDASEADAVGMTADFLRNIQWSAMKGDVISGSTGDSYTEAQVFDEQLPYFLDELSKGNIDTKIIPKTIRSAFDTLVGDSTSFYVLQRGFDVVQEERAKQKLAEAQRLEKEAQIRTFAPQQLGRHALRAVVGGDAQPAMQQMITSDMIPKAPTVEDIPLSEEAQPEIPATKEQVMGRLTENFTIEEMQSLREYSDALEDKRRAQKEGNGKNSEYFGQVVGQVERQMSPRVRAVARQYERVYNS